MTGCLAMFGRWRWGLVVAGLMGWYGGLCAWAGTFTWTGGDGSSQLWSTSTNWSGGAVPISASDTILNFNVLTNPGTSANPLQQDIANPLQLNELTFGHDADVSYHISGNPLQFVANGATQPMFRNYGWYDKWFYNGIQVPVGTTLRLINDTYNMKIQGVISGDGALRMEAQAGGGEWHLYATNIYTGGTIYNGTANANQGYCRLAVYASGGLGTGLVTLNGGNISTATLASPRAGLHFMTANTSFSNNFQLQADSPIFASNTNISLSGNVDLSNKTLYLRGTGSATLSGTISGAGSITKLDTGTWTLSGNNTYTGTTTISAGTLLLGHPNALGSATSTVQLGDSGTGDNNIALLTDVWADHTGAFTIARNIAVNNVGAGTVTIGSNAAGASGKYVVFSGTITLNNKDLHLKGINVDRTTFTGKITGTGNLYIDGPQRITFEANNDFVGDVYLTAGVLQLTTPNVIPDAASIIMSSGTTLRLLRSEAINALRGDGTVTGLTGFPNVVFTVGAGNGSGSFSGTIQDGGSNVSLVKTGAGAQTLTGPLNYTGGTTVNGGTLVLAQPGLGWTANGQFESAGHVITVNSGATLRLTERALLGNGQAHQLVINGGTVEFLHETYQSKIEMTGGRIYSDPAGQPITNVWRTGNAGDGLITVKASSTSSRIEGRLSFVKTASATKTTFDVEDGPAVLDLIVSANIIDHGGGYEGMELVKTGAGTMVLSGTNTYIGPTTIQAGKLLLNGTHTPAATPGLYTIAAAGTLGGTGTTKAPVLVQGTIAPGASVGTIHTGSQTWAPGGIYQWEIQDVDAGPGVGWDLVNITGTLSITATAANPFVIDVVSLASGGLPGLVGDFDPLSVYSWEIARTTAGVIDFAQEKFLIDLGNFQNYWHGGRWWVSLGNQGNSVFLNYAIPEPASGLLALLALGGLALWRWMSKIGK